ncbi:MAG TPA: pentapeptide repeat-containing protein [Solirubrobacterales bacterium]|nr:pentapeptide repeat-containing protein [Solirubrobacterales bacterium]
MGPVDFSGIYFHGEALFDGAKFHDTATFDRAKFEDHADFDNAHFLGPVSFDQAVFEDHAGFQDARFSTKASFAQAEFRAYADFERTCFEEDASLREATFQLARRLGPIKARKTLVLNGCVFNERLLIEIEAETFSAQAAFFADGVRLSVRRAAVFLNEADFGRASTLSSPADPLTDANSIEKDAQGGCQARLITIRGAQVARLSLSDLDLHACRFFGAHGLESLIVEPSCEWPRTPLGLRVDREVIAEEHHWRCERDSRIPKWRLGRRQWAAHATDPCDWPDSRSRGEPLHPEDLATLYRALRKAREDNKDQAGAGDLYYGEMEMRRVTPRPNGRGKIRALCDRAIITSYWLLSGYGLKASRAFFAWLCVIAAAGFGLYKWGIVPSQSHPQATALGLPQAMLFSLENTSSLIRLAHLPDDYELRLSGEIIQVVIRLVGPLLIGLWLLALRARVKR